MKAPAPNRRIEGQRVIAAWVDGKGRMNRVTFVDTGDGHRASCWLFRDGEAVRSVGMTEAVRIMLNMRGV